MLGSLLFVRRCYVLTYSNDRAPSVSPCSFTTLCVQSHMMVNGCTHRGLAVHVMCCLNVTVRRTKSRSDKVVSDNGCVGGS